MDITHEYDQSLRTNDQGLSRWRGPRKGCLGAYSSRQVFVIKWSFSTNFAHPWSQAVRTASMPAGVMNGEAKFDLAGFD
jgi:hypothetical protein